MKSAGMQGRLTKKQSSAVVAALLTELERRGVPASDLRKVASKALAPGPIDVLAARGA